MSACTNITEIQSILSNSGDHLYNHLSDLISALEDAARQDESSGRTACAGSAGTPRKLKRKKAKRNLNDGGRGAGSSASKFPPPVPLSQGSSTSKHYISSPEAHHRSSSFVAEPGNADMSGSETKTLNGSLMKLAGKDVQSQGCSLKMSVVFNLPESDSLTEMGTPNKIYRRKRLVKRMAVDDYQEIR
ncbi:unnamed protein product [Soboliphyme baturini]|uniref:SGF29 C-terminal domain-containing protein n=1 Tax=Soboliphyme baturini TaxID=241478 RepID=A0A183J515_9BILA|nr:unnamed protein product [Soboliphyme baturini]